MQRLCACILGKNSQSHRLTRGKTASAKRMGAWTISMDIGDGTSADVPRRQSSTNVGLILVAKNMKKKQSIWKTEENPLF